MRRRRRRTVLLNEGAAESRSAGRQHGGRIVRRRAASHRGAQQKPLLAGERGSTRKQAGSAKRRLLPRQPCGQKHAPVRVVAAFSKSASSWVSQHQRQARANEPWPHERAHRARTVRRRPTAAPKLRACVMPFLRTAMVCARIAIPAANEPTRSPELTCYRHRPRQWPSLALCLLLLHLSLLRCSCCAAPSASSLCLH